MITLSVLCFGDHVLLAQRCVESVITLCTAAKGDNPVKRVMLFANSASSALRDYLQSASTRLQSCDVEVQSCIHERNWYKYPLMRTLILPHTLTSIFANVVTGSAPTPLTSEYLMWFDDDSYIKTPTKEWLQTTIAKMQDCDMMGSVYTVDAGSREEWITKQTWWRGKPFEKRNGKSRLRFATGGWWIARMSMLQALDFPPATLRHNGGDSLLGEMMRQNDYKLKHDRCDVAINADLLGRESYGIRRGYHEPPIGSPDYDPFYA